MKKIYLAIPYGGMEQSSFEQAKTATTKLINNGYNVLSPIVYGHVIAQDDPDIGTDWNYWKRMAEQYIEWCDEVWVMIPEEGMDMVFDSEGVKGEIKYAREIDIPVKLFKLTPEDQLEDFKLLNY